MLSDRMNYQQPQDLQFQLGIAQNQELCWDFSMYHEVPIGTLPDCRGDIMCQEHVRGQQG